MYPRYRNNFKPKRVTKNVSEATWVTSWPNEDRRLLLLERDDKELSLAIRRRRFWLKLELLPMDLLEEEEEKLEARERRGSMAMLCSCNREEARRLAEGSSSAGLNNIVAAAAEGMAEEEEVGDNDEYEDRCVMGNI